MKSQALHTVLCDISGKACRGNVKLITLGSERVNMHPTWQTSYHKDNSSY